MSVIIGLSDLHYAILTTDEKDATPVYETPVEVPGVISAKVNPNTDLGTLFADDGPFEVATSLGNIDMELNVADLELPVQAALLGHTYSGGVLRRKGSDTPPWVAIGFKSLKSNGSYRYTWLAKGKFAPSEQANDTKNDTVNFQTPTVKGSFAKRTSDDEWECHIDEDDDDFEVGDATAWFTNPYIA